MSCVEFEEVFVFDDVLEVFFKVFVFFDVGCFGFFDNEVDKDCCINKEECCDEEGYFEVRCLGECFYFFIFFSYVYGFSD